MTDKGIAERIKTRRQELGMTQDELAILLNYKSRSSIYKIEIGENDIPHSKISAFAKALETTPSYLMGWETDDNSTSSDGVSYRIRTIMKYKNIACSELAQKLSVPESDLYNFLYETPDSQYDYNDYRFQAIAEVLKVKPDAFWGYCTFGDDELEHYINFLLDKIQKNLTLTEKENTILSNYINGILMDSDMILFPNNIIPLPKTKEIPLIGNIACGEPILATENIADYIKVDLSINADFALKCKGDSMINARIFDGDIVYIRQQSDVDDGEIAAVLIGEEATLKKVYKLENKIILRPCNPMYDDIVYSNDELDSVRILGKAIMFTSLVRHGKQ